MNFRQTRCFPAKRFAPRIRRVEFVRVPFLGERIGVHHVPGATIFIGGIARVARVRGMRQ